MTAKLLKRKGRVPLGSERRVPGDYLQIKVAGQNAWRYKHHLIWEAAYGSIPEGHIIRFLDGDKTNFRLENLTITTYRQLLNQTKQTLKIPLGHERRWPGGYTQVKVAEPNVWLSKHRLIWETAHGPIPKGHVVRFLDGDRTNFRLENLVATTREEFSSLINQAPVGHEWHMPKGYIKIKIGPNSWQLKHYAIWEAAHGPVPKGHVLKFIDGNPQNVALSNLVLLSSGENQYMHKHFPPDLKGEMFETGLDLAKVAVTSRKLAEVLPKKRRLMRLQDEKS